MATKYSPCRKGHPRTDDNLYIDTRGYPRCRECKRINDRQRRQRIYRKEQP